MSRTVEDAGTISHFSPHRGQPGDVVPCTRKHQPKHGDDCTECGGAGKRRICAASRCYKYGCHGDCGLQQKGGA